MSSERVIKKYANRRLYDATASRHVTLNDLGKLVVEGHQIKVIDDKTGEDITRSVLLQIVAEQEHFARPILSSQLLHSILRFYGSQTEELTAQYLEMSVQNLIRQQDEIQKQISTLISSNISNFARPAMDAWLELQKQMSPAPPDPKDRNEE